MKAGVPKPARTAGEIITPVRPGGAPTSLVPPPPRDDNIVVGGAAAVFISMMLNRQDFERFQEIVARSGDTLDAGEAIAIALKEFGERYSSGYTREMDAASALKAAALSYGLPKDVAEAIGDLAAKAARENTSRATAAPRQVTAAELDDVPPALQVKQHKKYEFPPELLADPERVKAELSISNARKRKISNGRAAECG